MTDVQRLLVTGDAPDLLRASQRTSFFANWIESRERDGRETYLVSVWGNERAEFLNVARMTGVTVEEIIGAGDDEEYVLLVGAPGTGWDQG